jgi:Methyltransferase domain
MTRMNLCYLFVFIAFFCAMGVPSARAADAPFVVTLPTVVDTMLKMGRVNAGDYLIDLGSGDGRIVIAAAKQHGARGYGVELDPNLVLTARREAQRQGVADRVTFEAENLFNIDIGKASIITMYIGESVNMRLRPALLKLKPGTRIVSHDFDLGNWRPDEKATIAVPNKPYGPPRSDIMLWVVPADFSGTWTWKSPVAGTEASYEARFEQTFQMIEGKGSIAARQAAVGSPQIRGDTIRFVMGAEVAGKATWREFEGRISGDTITGTASAIVDDDKAILKGTAVPWRATRTARGKWMTDSPPAAFEPTTR